MPTRISNRQARRIFLSRQGLCAPPGRRLDKQGLLALIHDLGFVQVDSINTVERAHHMILFSRNQTYRRSHLQQLLEVDRQLFENWTHDASIIPTAFYRYWRHRFERERERLDSLWQKRRRTGFQEAAGSLLERIREHGELRSRDTLQPPPGSDGPAGGSAGPRRGSGDGWWDWHPSKTALELLWRTGELAVSRREGFQKVYDLSQRVIPEQAQDEPPGEDEVVDWACSSALDRLGFATSGELAAFWEAISPDQAAQWVTRTLGRDLVALEVASADSSRPREVLARPRLLDELDDLPRPPPRLRLLSPFDPLLRDRNRAQRLFGFRYRIEVFVPAHRREYGYYVFPMLEGERLVGRIDLKHERADGTLRVQGLWWEPGVRAGAARLQRLQAELERLRRFLGAARISFDAGV